MSSNKPPLDQHIAARTAEALALPQMVCHRRDCRRAHACRWHFKTTGEPCCLKNLDPGQRTVFDRLYRDAHFAKSFLGTDSHLFETPEGMKRDMDDLAIEIARSAPSRYQWKQWDPARRRRAKRMRLLDRTGYGAKKPTP